MMALPFITEHSSFKGKVYATEPTVRIGKQLMEELVQYDAASTIIDHPLWQKREILR